MRWSVSLISLRILHSLLWSTVKGFHIVNEAEVDLSVCVFLEFPCFLYDPTDAGNLISASFAFSGSSLYIWKFLVHILLKCILKDFEYYLASMWNENNCTVVWTFFGVGMKTELFHCCGHCWVFQICWHIECNILTASCFRILNGLAGIPSPPLLCS